ncbi:hypothetical protein CL614_01350 [archaeon]|nr:hypothetical protein [archaeon]|tara:strand:+ start:680 stop:916 length:237 start_codon:yes stop_codon:yes gene_type:complete
MIDLLRELIREEIKKLIQDDALFRRGEISGIVGQRDQPGIEPEFTRPEDSCPECEKIYPDLCPGHRTLRSLEPDFDEI